jgi:hypothetical protein
MLSCFVGSSHVLNKLESIAAPDLAVVADAFLPRAQSKGLAAPSAAPRNEGCGPLTAATNAQ